MAHIKIILGSNRPTRFAEQPGTWLLNLGQKVEGATFELIDLAELNLPFLDEPAPALYGTYQNEHTKAWSKVVAEADGFIFVVPEYNHGYTPVLKNAIDYLYHEWSHKPVAFLSYGSAAGGARAVDQLRAVVGHLSMYDITEHVIMPEYYAHQDENGTYQFSERHENAARTMLERLVFWAGKMAPARAELAKRVK
jgi:NAD(P)H-dependent FMN reductase